MTAPFVQLRNVPARFQQAEPLLRDEVEQLIEGAIDALDAFDGDPDLEDYDPDLEEDDSDRCEAGDDGLTSFWRYGFPHWGSREEATELLPVPDYGIDQTKGPSE